MAVSGGCLTLIFSLPILIAFIGDSMDLFSNNIHRHMEQIKKINQTGAYLDAYNVYIREYLIVDNNFSNYGYDCMYPSKKRSSEWEVSLWIEVQYNYEILSKSIVFAGCSSGVRTPLGVLNQKIVMHALTICSIELVMIIVLLACMFLFLFYRSLGMI